jgi:hypothetical protein
MPAAIAQVQCHGVVLAVELASFMVSVGQMKVLKWSRATGFQRRPQAKWGKSLLQLNHGTVTVSWFAIFRDMHLVGVDFVLFMQSIEPGFRCFPVIIMVA